jgi:hypothetical protein
MKLMIVALASLTLNSCAGSVAWQSIKMSETASQAKSNNDKIMSLQVGQLKSEIVTTMGPASKREAYQLPGQRTVEFLFYRTSGWSAIDGGDTDNHFTPFAFEDDKLTGWGRNLYSNVVKASIDLTVKGE